MKTLSKLLLLSIVVLLVCSCAHNKKSVANKNKQDSVVINNDTTDDDVTFVVLEEYPEFPGGMEALMDFLSKNIKYPEAAKEQGIEGRVFVTFVVEKNGSVNNVKVVRDIGGGCGEEAARVVKMMPKWKPGKQNGKVVRTQFNLPIKFSLD
ncbi:MAG: energy transducer TonB [Bacteroidales bacterium]|nr:energy transducer TonB [Bacteroidales bacterium]